MEAAEGEALGLRLGFRIGVGLEDSFRGYRGQSLRVRVRFRVKEYIWRKQRAKP